MYSTEYYYKINLWLRSIKGIGRVSVRKALLAVNDPERVLLGGLEDLRELESVLERPGRFLINARDYNGLETAWTKAKTGCDAILGIWDPKYPQSLKALNDPPLTLHCKGNYQWLGESFSGVGMVGTRSPSDYGRQHSFELAKSISSRGKAVISGLAMGIDATAHLGALSGGGKTVAVLGCGVDVCYPKSNQKLYNQMLQSGLIISEYPAGTSPQSMHFPERNRIIAGLSNSCIVIEAAKKSGSLITAEMVMDLGRDVYALPGPIHSLKSAGCHWLIRDGAVPIVDEKTLLEDLGLRSLATQRENKPLETDQFPILDILSKEGALTLDMLHLKSGLPIGDIIAQLEALISENYVKSCGFLYHI